jgi:Family of unknown function (DUF695)
MLPNMKDESFSILEGTIDGRPLFAMVNSALRAFDGKEALPFFLSIGTQLRNPTSDGLVTSTEADDLNNWEEALESRLASQGVFVFVGRVTWNGQRELLYYLESREPFMAALKEFSDHQSTRPFKFFCERDSCWHSVDLWLDRCPA